MDAGVFATMVDEIRGLGHMLLDVFGVPFAILHAVDVIVFRAREVIVERDDPMTGFDETLAEMRAHEAGPSGHENKFLVCHGGMRILRNQRMRKAPPASVSTPRKP